MNRIKMMAAGFVVLFVALAFSPNVTAQTWNQKTIVTTSQTIEIPGVGQQFLPAGTYVFKLLDSQTNRHIVQIFSEDQSHLFATILAIPNYRLRPTGDTVITFRERPVGQPEALRAWFYPGATWGHEFVYPESRAIELAQVAMEPVLAMPAELAPHIAAPISSALERPAMAMMAAPLKAVTPAGEKVELAQVVEPPPTASAEAATVSRSHLPQTASPLALLGLLGLLSLGAGIALWALPKRTA